MRMLNKFGLCLVMAGAASAANAEIVIDNQTIASSDIDSYSISVNEDGTYRLEVTTLDGWTVTPVDNGDGGGDGGGNTVTINNFVSSKSYFPQFKGVSISWTTSGATSCVGSGGTGSFDVWNGARGLSNDNFRVNNIENVGVQTLTLTCNDGADASSTDSVSFELYSQNGGDSGGDDTGGGDDTAGSTSVTCPTTSEVANGEVDRWDQFWDADFPEVARTSEDKYIGATAYYAVRFNTGEFNGNGQLEAVQITSGIRNVAISQCRGEFTSNAVMNGCLSQQANGQKLEFSTDGSSDCDLEPNTNYYINITYKDILNQTEGSSWCGGSTCGYRLKYAWFD